MHNIVLAGENAILIVFGDQIDPALPTKIATLSQQLTHSLGALIINLIPSYTSLHISYDLNKITHQALLSKVEALLTQTHTNIVTFKPQTIRIPVYYNTDVGLDLAQLLTNKNLDLATFINIHSDKKYTAYAIGFSPVFAYLGEVDKRIQAPRLATPRIKIPAGSVGIAQHQTAVYPTDSSGGWNIIGRTPLDLSLNNPDNINKFRIGDSVQFYPIRRDEYLQLGGKLWVSR